MKHKHYDMIVAWANGETIQGSLDAIHWVDIQNPYWDAFSRIRIKPPTRPQWQQNLIDAAKAGKIVEFEYAGSIAPWVESTLNEALDEYDFSGNEPEHYRIRPSKITRYLWAEKAYARWLEGR